MTQQKTWVKTGVDTYTLTINNEEIGKLSTYRNTMDSKAIALTEAQTWHFKRTGFWKNNIEVTDSYGQMAMKMYNKKGYANTSTLDYNGNEYQVVVRNNPLAEFAVLDKDKMILAYGLTVDEENALKIKITSGNRTTDTLFDFLLWYLFLPTVYENTGDNFAFMTLQAIT